MINQKETANQSINSKTNPEAKITEEKPKAEVHAAGHTHAHLNTGDHPHHHHIEPALIIRVEDLVDAGAYLLNIYKMKEKVQTYYQKNCLSYVNYWKDQYDIEFTLEGYKLINLDIVIDMKEFLKQNWLNVQYIGFSGCKIDDIKWRMFVEHAYLFPNLRWISLKIKHTINVKQGDLQNFKSLQRIQFTYEQWTHPLTIPGKNYLKSFAKAHPAIQVVFG